MDKEAGELVDVFIASGEQQYTKSYYLKRNGERTGEKVVVVVMRTSPKLEKAITEFAVEAHKAVAGPKGMACPMCNGTGRIS